MSHATVFINFKHGTHAFEYRSVGFKMRHCVEGELAFEQMDICSFTASLGRESGVDANPAAVGQKIAGMEVQSASLLFPAQYFESTAYLVHDISSVISGRFLSRANLIPPCTSRQISDRNTT